jgi:HSP20 family protein
MVLPVRRRTDDAPEAPAGWGPLAELDRLNRELAHYLDSWRQLPNLVGGFTPLADVEETPDAYEVEVEVPGVRREDISIEIAGRRLSVHGERKEKERVGILRRRERVVGRFSCEVTLLGRRRGGPRRGPPRGRCAHRAASQAGARPAAAYSHPVTIAARCERRSGDDESRPGAIVPSARGRIRPWDRNRLTGGG